MTGLLSFQGINSSLMRAGLRLGSCALLETSRTLEYLPGDRAKKKPPSAEGKGRRGVQTLDSSELFTLRGGTYETIGDKQLSFNLMAMLN